MKRAFEFVVIGVGGIGSAAAYWLARMAGSEVLALEQFRIGHDNGASQDHSRIIRLSYHAPEYTALTPATYQAFAEVEEASGVQLVLKCGGLDLAPEGSQLLEPYKAAMRAASIPFDDMDARETMERFPQWRLRPGDRALYQQDGGLVDAGKSIQVHVALARLHGATVLAETKMLALTPVADGVTVETTNGSFHAGRVVVAADAWTNHVLAETGAQYPLTVTKEQVTYWSTPHLRDFAPDRFPIWIWHGGRQADFYGFPVYGEVATKAGEDVGGDVVTADTRSFDPNPAPHARLTAFLSERCPDYLGPELYTKTCLYTMTPDRNFVIERLPEHPQIAVALGAAHAFKFSSLIGQILADLAVEGETRFPIDAFTGARRAIVDPSFVPAFTLSPEAATTD